MKKMFSILSICAFLSVVSCSDDNSEKKAPVDSDQTVTDTENGQTGDDEVSDSDTGKEDEVTDEKNDEASGVTDDDSSEDGDDDKIVVEKRFTVGDIANSSSGTVSTYDGKVTLDDGTEGSIKIRFSGSAALEVEYLELPDDLGRGSIEVKVAASTYTAAEGTIHVQSGNVLMGKALFSVKNLKLTSDKGDVLVADAEFTVDSTETGDVTPGSCKALTYNPEDTAKNDQGYFPQYQNFQMKDADGSRYILSVEFHGEKADYLEGTSFELGKGANSRENCNSGGICFEIWTDKDNNYNDDNGLDEDRFLPVQGKLTIEEGGVFTGACRVKIENLKTVRYVLNDSYQWEPVEDDCISMDNLSWDTLSNQ